MPAPTISTEPLESELRESFWKHVKSFPEGEKLQTCLQCGTCTGSCPVSYTMDITPRQTVALFRAGRIEEILRSRTIWICASCYSCTVRCPVDIRVTDTLYALKRLAMERNIYPRRFPVNRLARGFMRNIRRYGRNYEMGLGIGYYLRTKPSRLLGSAGLGLSLLGKGRLGVTPRTIKSIKQVRALIAKAEQSGGS